jgi:hypothetical protein
MLSADPQQPPLQPVATTIPGVLPSEQGRAIRRSTLSLVQDVDDKSSSDEVGSY